jgi:phenylalanyl-tRNA synthetase beta chain
MSLNGGGREWQVSPPSHRFDIAVEEDLIEEIGRIIGYDKIATAPELVPIRLGRSDERRLSQDAIADALIARGYSEVVNYSFGDPADFAALFPDDGSARLTNPISGDLAALRTSIWPGLLRTAQQNLSRQRAGCRLFEVGTVFATAAGAVAERTELAGLATGPIQPEHWDSEQRMVDFYDLKNELELLFNMSHCSAPLEFIPAKHPALDPGKTAELKCKSATIGWLGALHPRLKKRFGLKQDVVLFAVDFAAAFPAQIPKYRSLSKFPSVRRDLAILVDEKVPVGDITLSVRATLGEVLQDLVVFDLYRGESIGSRRKSVGIGLILQDASRTLTDNDADGMVDEVMHQLEHRLGATIRT